MEVIRGRGHRGGKIACGTDTGKVRIEQRDMKELQPVTTGCRSFCMEAFCGKLSESVLLWDTGSSVVSYSLRNAW